ncbi:hypothetical protein PANDA_015155 [Ailuropoda melanoleuca]|uniref:Podoplanin n=1 Tax=Ailuropoda melanoleuca TaxID=9646 RepID=D2HST4_AILME|nr:hypothetical protein PANDA_015155 [Ailuropoda melanoleuca]
MVTAGTSVEPYESGLTAAVPINREGVTDLRLEDRATESTVRAEEETQSTTTLNVVTSHPTGKRPPAKGVKDSVCKEEKVGEDTETTVEKDGLATVTLVGIIVGVLLAIGFIGGIIIVVVRKMSGRYSLADFFFPKHKVFILSRLSITIVVVQVCHPLNLYKKTMRLFIGESLAPRDQAVLSGQALKSAPPLTRGRQPVGSAMLPWGATRRGARSLGGHSEEVPAVTSV